MSWVLNSLRAKGLPHYDITSYSNLSSLANVLHARTLSGIEASVYDNSNARKLLRHQQDVLSTSTHIIIRPRYPSSAALSAWRVLLVVSCSRRDLQPSCGQVSPRISHIAFESLHCTLRSEMLCQHIHTFVQTHESMPQATMDPLLIEQPVSGSALKDEDKLAYLAVHLTGCSNSRHASDKPSRC
jgi:hypothetical protein